MSDFTLKQLQQEQKIWQEHNFPHRLSFHPLMGMMEELGELTHAQLKGEQKIRYTPDQVDKRKRDAVGDIMVYMVDYCSAYGIDLDAAMRGGEFWGYIPEFLSDFLVIKHAFRYLGLVCEYHEFDLDRVKLYLCQVVQSLRSYCKRNGCDFMTEVFNTWSKVKQRDWQKNPIDAHAKVEGSI